MLSLIRHYPSGDIAVELTVADMTAGWADFPICWFQWVGSIGDDLCFDVWFAERRRKRSEKVDEIRRLVGVARWGRGIR